MKTTRTYPSICITCNGNGILGDQTSTTSPFRTCPVCNGAKTITITEIIEDETNPYLLSGSELEKAENARKNQ